MLIPLCTGCGKSTFMRRMIGVFGGSPHPPEGECVHTSTQCGQIACLRLWRTVKMPVIWMDKQHCCSSARDMATSAVQCRKPCCADFAKEFCPETPLVNLVQVATLTPTRCCQTCAPSSAWMTTTVWIASAARRRASLHWTPRPRTLSSCTNRSRPSRMASPSTSPSTTTSQGFSTPLRPSNPQRSDIQEGVSTRPGKGDCSKFHGFTQVPNELTAVNFTYTSDVRVAYI